MTKPKHASAPLRTLEAVRGEIDRVDESIVVLLAERGRLVQQASRFKRTVDEAPAPDRARAVVQRVRELAAAHGADAELVGEIYTLMIRRFVAREIDDIRARDPQPERPA